ncbi:MAG: Chromatin protein Cren7 [uncultured Acidilobus sp. CIS]|jgi:hypothetical protein|nr:MAG: Chromatin protein Cren7 [uncultured Acidilobus sp. CIS]ESQ25705.1 MAG: Chromatin protein Cren7 [uncultured Acidilobus sp. JCHS]NAZ39136.1 hypothetical protein [Acidilobus sp.]
MAQNLELVKEWVITRKPARVEVGLFELPDGKRRVMSLKKGQEAGYKLIKSWTLAPKHVKALKAQLFRDKSTGKYVRKIVPA